MKARRDLLVRIYVPGCLKTSSSGFWMNGVLVCVTGTSSIPVSKLSPVTFAGAMLKIDAQRLVKGKQEGGWMDQASSMESRLVYEWLERREEKESVCCV